MGAGWQTDQSCCNENISGTVGTTIVYSGSNIAVFLNTPPEMAGVVGGVFNSVGC